MLRNVTNDVNDVYVLRNNLGIPELQLLGSKAILNDIDFYCLWHWISENRYNSPN